MQVNGGVVKGDVPMRWQTGDGVDGVDGANGADGADGVDGDSSVMNNVETVS